MPRLAGQPRDPQQDNQLPMGVENNMKKGAPTEGKTPSQLIDARIAELDGWRGKALSHVRTLIKQVDPDVVYAMPS